MSQTVDGIWLERVAAYRESGMTARKWCEENEVNYNSFKNCVTKYTKILAGEGIHEASTESFQWTSVDLSKVSSQTSSGITLEIGSVKIHLTESFDERLLSKTIKALTATC